MLLGLLLDLRVGARRGKLLEALHASKGMVLLHITGKKNRKREGESLVCEKRGTRFMAVSKTDFSS